MSYTTPIPYPIKPALRLARVRKGTAFQGILRLSALVAFMAAASPLIPWYIRRVTDDSDEPLGILALLVAVFFAWHRFRDPRERLEVQVYPWQLLIGSGAIGLVELSPYGNLPLFTGLFVIAVLSSAISLSRGKTGFVALLILSLPLMASLDFYAGYPLRLAAAQLSELLLNLCGMEVERAGVLISDQGSVVGVDPPCAGVRMLWTASFTAAVVATRLRFSCARAAALLVGAVVCVILGNGLRAAVLFFPESGRFHLPGWMHEGAGLLVHGGVLFTIFALGEWLESRKAHSSLFSRLPQVRVHPFVFTSLLLGTSLAAILSGTVSSAPPDVAAKTPTLELTVWPAMLDGIPLHSVPLSASESRFAALFPGSLAKFNWGEAIVILRRSRGATRLMHSSNDCLAASGYTITHKPVYRDADGRMWGCSQAEREGHTWRVRERYTNDAGTHFATDASAWFWLALLHPDAGPWTSTTIMELTAARP